MGFSIAFSGQQEKEPQHLTTSVVLKHIYIYFSTLHEKNSESIL